MTGSNGGAAASRGAAVTEDQVRQARASAATATADWLDDWLIALTQAEQIHASVGADQAVALIRQLQPLSRMARNEQRALADDLLDPHRELVA